LRHFHEAVIAGTARILSGASLQDVAAVHGETEYGWLVAEVSESLRFDFEEANAGEADATVTVTPIDDSSADPGETVTVTISTSSSYHVGTANTASMMVVDDESQLVTVTKIADAFEGGAGGMFRFTRTGDTSSSLTVNYTVSGTATSGTDYTALSGSVTFAAA